MKTRDLMRGDKVYETLLEDTPQVVMVEEVGQNHIYIGMEDDDMALLRYEPEHLGWDIKHIEPIPLSKEIMKTIGFVFDDDHYAHIEYNDYQIGFHYGKILRIGDQEGRLILQLSKKNWMFHEFQHALGICGLSKLADNINIK